MNSKTNVENYTATLVSGQIYTLEGIQYRKGEPRVVDALTKEYLEENAVIKRKFRERDELGDYTQTETRCRFTFAPILSEEQLAKAKKEEVAQDRGNKTSTKKSLSTLRAEGANASESATRQRQSSKE